MRTVTAFVATLLVLLGGGVVADVLLAERAEEQASALLGAQLDAPTSVRLRGWPVSLNLLRGAVPAVVVEVADLPVDGGVRAREVRVELAGVRIDGAAALATGLGGQPAATQLEADSGRFAAELDDDALSQLAGMPVHTQQEQARIETPVGLVDAVAALEDDDIVLRPVGDVPDEVGPVRLEPPGLPGDARLTAVQLTPGALRLEGAIRRLDGAVGAGAALRSGRRGDLS